MAASVGGTVGVPKDPAKRRPPSAGDPGPAPRARLSPLTESESETETETGEASGGEPAGEPTEEPTGDPTEASAEESTEEPTEEPAETSGWLTRNRAALVIVPIIALIVGNNLGNAFFPSLVTGHPLWLIALSPSNRNFVLVANRVDPVSYYVVGTLRLLAPDPLFFLLGRWYGEAAINWMEQRTPTYGKLMRTLERWFTRASWPLVVIMPNNPVCLLAGAAGMGVAIFAVLNVVGTIGRLILLRILGDAFTRPINWLIDLIGQYRLPLLALTVAIVAFSVFREWRAGTSEIEQLLELEEELDDPDDHRHHHHHADGHADGHVDGRADSHIDKQVDSRVDDHELDGPTDR